MMLVDKTKIVAGRKNVDSYRVAHTQLHKKPYYRGVHKDHTPLLETLVKRLEALGFASAETEFEPKKTEILAKFWDASNELNLADTGIYDQNIYRVRKDLAILGEAGNSDGVELRDTEQGKQLLIDEKVVMDTTAREHIIMRACVAECPANARVFIGGLGLGLVLLYLAESGKAREVIVAEIDARVLDLLKSRIGAYLNGEYPGFNLQIIQGDAFEKIKDLGKFDWIFFDLTDSVPDGTNFDPSLTDGGVFTDYALAQRLIDKDWWK